MDELKYIRQNLDDETNIFVFAKIKDSDEFLALIGAAGDLKQACERALKHVNHAYKAFPTNELLDLRYELNEALEKANDY